MDVACPHCKNEILLLEDPDPNSEVKRYSDSPYGTFNAQNLSKAGFKITAEVIEEEQNLEKEDSIELN